MAGNYPNPSSDPNATVSWSIIEADRFNFPPELAYATTGAINIAINNNNRAYIGLTGNATFSLTGMADMLMFWLDLKNTTAGTLTLTWPAWGVANGVTLPTTLAAGAYLSISLRVIGTTIGDVIVVYAGSGNTLPSGGAKYARLAKNSTTNYDAGWYGPDAYNVRDYGATGDGSTDDYTAIAAAISAGIATGKPFCLYAPAGIYKSSHAFTVTLANDGQAFSVRGDGMGISQFLFSDTGSDAGFDVTRISGGGTYTADAPGTFADFSVISNGAGVATGLKLTQTGGNNSACQNTVISRVGFYVSTLSSTYWQYGIDVMCWLNVEILDCTFITNSSAGVRIRGTTGFTSIFWITNCRFQGGTYGVLVDGTGGAINRIEGVKVRDCEFIVQDYCVYGDNANAGGVFSVIGGSMVAAVKGVYLKNFRGSVVSGINITPSGSPNPWTGVGLYDCRTSTVNGNSIVGPNGANSCGVLVDGAANNGDGVTVYGNQMELVVTAVGLTAGVGKCVVTNNVSLDGGLYTDLGAADVLANNI